MDCVAQRAEVARVLASSVFSNSPRMSRFLRFVVEEVFASRGDRLKESVIAVEVFDKDPGYDPRADSTVRTEASKLRTKLRTYYETEGRENPFIISIPKGGYLPVFEARPLFIQTGESSSEAVPVNGHGRRDVSVRKPEAGTRTGLSTSGWRVAAAALVLVVLGSFAIYKWRAPLSARQRVRSQEARRFYSLAESYAANETSEKIQNAVQYFQLALDADPGFAPAHAALSLAYTSLAVTEAVPTLEVLAQARTQAIEALRLDRSLAESHHAMARVLLLGDYDWDGADREFREAVAIDPAYTDARFSYAHMCLNARGLHDAAAAQLQEGLQRDPFSVKLNAELGRTDVTRGRIDQGIARLRTGLASYPNSPGLLTRLAPGLQEKSQYEEALSALVHAQSRVPDNAWVVSHLAVCYVHVGRRTEAETILRQLTTHSNRSAIPEVNIAAVYAALGEPDVAFEHLDRAFSQRSAPILWLNIDRRFEPLRSDRRFAVLLKKLRLRSD